MKKFVAIVLAISIITALLNGCSLLRKTTVSETQTGGEVSRAEFVQMVYDNFAFDGCKSTEHYYDDVTSDNQNFDAIQCSYEWGYIEKTDNDNCFYPDNSATTYFAAGICVRAVGVDIINVSGYSLQNDEDILDFYSDKTGYDLRKEELLTESDAEFFVDSITEIENTLELEEHSDIHYADNAYVVNDNAISLNESTKTAELSIGQAVNVGDYLVLESSAQYYSGKAVKIMAVNGSTVTYEDANVEDILTDVYITGSAIPEIVGFSCEDENTTIREINPTEIGFDKSRDVTIAPLGTAKTSVSPKNVLEHDFNVGDKAFEITSKINKNCSVKVKFALTDITAHVYLDANIEEQKIERFKFGLSSTAVLQATITGKLEKKIPTKPFRIEASFFKIIGIGINVCLKVSVSGAVTLKYSFDQATYINYKKGCMPKLTPSIKFNDPEIKLNAKANIVLDFSISPDLLTKPIIDVGIAGGVEGSASLNQYDCLDLDLYLVAYCYAGSGDSIIGGLVKMDFKREFITKSNSPWKKHLHIEKGKVVDKCTMKDGSTTKSTKEDKGKNKKENSTNNKQEKDAGDWKQAYIDYLKKYMNEVENPEICGFSLVYIDNDDTPELVIRNGDSHVSGASVYTCVNSEVVELVGDLSGTFGIIGYAERKGLIYSNVTYQGNSTTTIYSVDSGNCKQLISLFTNEAATPEGMDPEYAINDKPVSEDEYNAAWGKYEDNNISYSYDNEMELTIDAIESINSY